MCSYLQRIVMHAQILPSPRALCLFDPQGGHAPVGSTFRGRWPGDLFWRTGVCVCLYVCVCVCVCVSGFTIHVWYAC